MWTYIPNRSWCVRGRSNDLHRSGGGRRGQRDHPTLQLIADSSRRMTLMIRQISRASRSEVWAHSGDGNAAPWISKRVADWLDRLGIQTVTLKCDNNPATLAPAQEIRRLRIESSITILQHSEEVEKQGDHLAEASVNIVKGLITILKSSTESKLRPEIGPSHPLIPWITEHSAQLKNRYMAGAASCL